MRKSGLESGIDWNSPSYEALRRSYRWHIPERFNLSVAACSRHADGSGRRALVDVRHEGGAWHVSSYTFDELDNLTGRFAAVLAGLGVERGDRVAVFLPQRLETGVAHLATFRLGAISVPLSPLFRADALDHRLRASGAKVLVTDAAHHLHLAELADLPELRHVVCCEDDVQGTVGWSTLTSSVSAPAPAVDTSADDPAMIVYTSGTSGKPKGALHAHRFIPGRLPGFELVHALERESSDHRPFWTPADWAWIGGLADCVLTPWAFGQPVLAFRRQRFDPAEVYELLDEVGARSLFLPPTALNRMRFAAPPKKLPDVFSVHTAGEPLSEEAYEWARDTFGRVFELYGMTEIGAIVGNSPFFDVKAGAMGKPYPGHDVVLLDGDAVVEGPGVGEIAVRKGDPGMFLGYWNDEEGTRKRFRGDYLVTGDVARRDEDGYFWYVGRNDDMFNTSGYRVGPTEIEETIESHPAVRQAAVVGIPDAERGHVVKAFVVTEAGASRDGLAEEIQRFVKSRLAAYEYPRQIVFARDLPRTVTGKVLRRELRSPEADKTWGI